MELVEKRETPRSFNPETVVEDFAGPGRIIERDGRHIWLKVNGWTLSATWDRATYCGGARHNGSVCLAEPERISPNAEVAAWKDGGIFIDLHGDSVEGWVSPASFLAAVEAAERDDEDGIRSALVREPEESASPPSK